MPIQERIYLKKDGTYVINFDESKLIETHWIASHVNGYDGRASYDGIQKKQLNSALIL